MSEAKDTSRDVAVAALRDRSGNVSAHLQRRAEELSLSSEDKNFAQELALGTLRRQGTLTAVLQRFLRQPERALAGALGEILQVALYQMLFLDRVPEFAAVNEAVKQTAKFHLPQQSGLVNAVLRSIARSLSPLQEGKPPFARDVLPVSSHSFYRFDKAIFAEPARQPAEYLAGAFSLPLPLARRWVARFAPLEKAAAIAMQSNARPPLICRVNSMRATVQSVLEALQAEDISAAAHANGLSVVLAEHHNVQNLEVFKNGWIQPQDPTATAVARVVMPQAGQSVLDFCAAPGTKTTHLAEMMNNQGSILAADVSQEKLQRIEDNARRLGIDIIKTIETEKTGGLELESFDRVLADVPCSNSGVLARRAEARWRFNEQGIGKLVRDQQFLAMAAAHFTRPGGRFVYSTCSIEEQECSQVARWLVQQDKKMRLLEEHLTLPGGEEDMTHWQDGGYYAVFQRS